MQLTSNLVDTISLGASGLCNKSIIYIKLINFTLKNNKIIHWTWVEPSNKFFTDEKQYEKTYYDLLEPYKKYLLIKEETNKEIDDFHYGEIAHLELSEDLYKKII